VRDPIAGVQCNGGTESLDCLVEQVGPIYRPHGSRVDTCGKRIKLLSRFHCGSGVIEPSRQAQHKAEPLVCGRIAGIQLECFSKGRLGVAKLPVKKE
jgi:hypothetical protein